MRYNYIIQRSALLKAEPFSRNLCTIHLVSTYSFNRRIQFCPFSPFCPLCQRQKVSKKALERGCILCKTGALYQSFSHLPNQSTNFDTKTAFHFGGLFLRLCPELQCSCGFRAFSVLGTVGAAALKSCLLHGRPLEIFKSIRLCTTFKTIRIQAGASLKTVPGLYTF